MNNFTLLPPNVKIRKCPSYFSGFFITLEWHLWLSELPMTCIFVMYLSLSHLRTNL